MDDGEQEISILLNVLSTDHRMYRNCKIQITTVPILLYLFCGNLSAGDFLNLTCLVLYVAEGRGGSLQNHVFDSKKVFIHGAFFTKIVFVQLYFKY